VGGCLSGCCVAGWVGGWLADLSVGCLWLLGMGDGVGRLASGRVVLRSFACYCVGYAFSTVFDAQYFVSEVYVVCF